MKNLTRLAIKIGRGRSLRLGLGGPGSSVRTGPRQKIVFDSDRDLHPPLVGGAQIEGYRPDNIQSRSIGTAEFGVPNRRTPNNRDERRREPSGLPLSPLWAD